MQDNETYWALIEAERQQRNALSQIREAQRLTGTPGNVRSDVSRIADELGDIVALAAASRRRLLEPERTAAQP
jgi:hypothetical protein